MRPAGPTSVCSRSGSSAGRCRAAGATRVPGVRPAVPRRAIAARCPPRAAQAAARAGRAAHGAGPGRAPDRDRGRGLLRGRQGTGARGHRGQAPPEPLRARTARLHLAQDQGAARAGACRGWLDAGGRRPPGSSAPWWSASTRASTSGSRARLARVSGPRPGDAQGAAGPARGGCPAVRPGATAGLPGTLGWRPRRCPLDAPGSRDPGRDRRLDTGRPRPPDGVQGSRPGPRSPRRCPRARGEPPAGRRP